MPMKKLLLFCTLMAMVSGSAQASGLGWYVYSFDWKKYAADKAQIESSINKCMKAGEEDPKWCGESQITRRFIGTLDEKATADVNYGVKDARPGDLEMFAIGFFREAYYIQIKRMPFTHFELFKSGRSEWKDQWVGCDGDVGLAWNCINSYVLMRPEEVSAFKKEVDELMNKKPSSTYEYLYEYLGALKLVLDSASKDNKALLFHAMD